MAVTLNNIDIETITGITRIHRPRLNNKALGIHSLQLSQHIKNMIHQYSVSGIWAAGDSDYDNKEAKIQNIEDAGLPVWFDGSSWRKSAMLFGKLHDFECRESDGEASITRFNFLITGVFPWGYTFIQDDGAGDFRIYDLDKQAQSRTINPILRKCNFIKTGTQITYSVFVKNIGSTGNVILEIMVPDGLTTANISTNVVTTKNAGDIGDSGISSTPGTKRRLTLTRNLLAGVEEQWDITITYSSLKTSFLDGSIDDIAA